MVKQEIEGENYLMLSQYIPLPAFKTSITKESSVITSFLREFRTPMFFFMFIIVLGAQIYWKKSKADREWEERKSQMGPIERQVLERGGFAGKPLNKKEMEEIRELDSMMAGMGNLNIGQKFGGHDDAKDDY